MRLAAFEHCRNHNLRSSLSIPTLSRNHPDIARCAVQSAVFHEPLSAPSLNAENSKSILLDIARLLSHVGIMSRPKRNLLATARDTMSPPDVLAPGHVLAQVVKAEGKNLFSVKEHNQDRALLVELPSRFRSQIWIKRNGYVVVNKEAFGERENKLDGEIVNIVRDEKQWRKQAYWYVRS